MFTLNKTNLLINQPQSEDGTVDFSVSIIPEIPGTKVDYEYEVGLKPEMEYKSIQTESLQEIIYVMTGSGIIKIKGLEEKVIRGDRIIITNKEQYQITNPEENMLLFLIIGISTQA